MTSTSITDLPRGGASETDRFGISSYEQGLERFLRGAATPITIALQGEWGSGKTSLMNVLRYRLCGNRDTAPSDFYSVWINTWEFSLMHSPSDALLMILLEMAKAVVSLNKSDNREMAEKIGRSLLGFGTAIVQGVANKLVEGSGDGMAKAILGDEENNISDLRKRLQEHIDACLTKNPTKKGVIFFIDDLDRIDPPVAVELLELLKNIFTLHHCIFVLAIDYDVVIKGLKPKFGELNEKNEREFRSFFDKIIQVPFSMPVAQYSTDNYIKEELRNIGVLDSADMTNDSLIQNIVRAEQLTIGPNPRSIKRFLNTLSLIKCIDEVRQQMANDGEQNSEQLRDKERQCDTFLRIATVGLQVAYPRVYQLLAIEPCFTLWNDATASKMNLPKLEETTQEWLKGFKEFQEDWEQVLYRLCLSDQHLQNNAIHISQLLNMMRSEILALRTDEPTAEEESGDAFRRETEGKVIGEFIQDHLNQTSVTGFSAGDGAKMEDDRGALMRKVQHHLFEYVEGLYRSQGYRFKPYRVRINGGIKATHHNDLRIYRKNDNGKILFEFRMDTHQRFQQDVPDFAPNQIPSKNKCHNINNLADFDCNIFPEYFQLRKIVEQRSCYGLWIMRHLWPNGKIQYNLCFNVRFDRPEAFVEPSSLQMMKEVTKVFFDICFKFNA